MDVVVTSYVVTCCDAPPVPYAGFRSEGLHRCHVTHPPCLCLLCHAGRVWVGGVIRKGGAVKVLGGLPEDTPEAPEIPTVSAKRVGKEAEERRVLLCHWHMCKVCGEKVCNIHNSKCGEV